MGKSRRYNLYRKELPHTPGSSLSAGSSRACVSQKFAPSHRTQVFIKSRAERSHVPNAIILILVLALSHREQVLI